MPTVLRIGPYRFFFYSDEGHEPQHIHVERDVSKAKFWLSPVRLERSVGFGGAELNKIQKLIDDHVVEMRRAWDEYFGA
jgi:5-enolpyruvylshikimate-3-phosphate synthase